MTSTSTSPTALVLEPHDGGVTVLRLNRPDCLNAINGVLRDELRSTLAELGRDDGTRAVVLTGAGRGFCAGLDVRDFGPGIPPGDAGAAAMLAFQESMAALPVAVRALPQPVVAAVNRPAVGAGMGLVLASDVRLCGASASFANGAIRLGLSGAEMGMSYYLPRIVGLSTAAEWMLTGRKVEADEALARGLVSQLLPDDELVDRAIELAGQIAAHSSLGVRMTKRALQTNVDAPDYGAALELENRNQVLTFGTDDSASARGAWSRR